MSFGLFLRWLLVLKGGKNCSLRPGDIEEEGTGRWKCACSIFKVWFILVTKGTSHGGTATHLQEGSLNCGNRFVWQWQCFWPEAV